MAYPKFIVIRSHPLILFRKVNTFGEPTILCIKAPFDSIDLDFYHEQNWAYTNHSAYVYGEKLPGHIVLSTKEEVNAALVQAEITHRLRHS